MTKPQEALPCPFCGKQQTLQVISGQELMGEDQEFWQHSDSFGVVCDASSPDGKGGCGAMGGFRPTEDEAIEAWNTRTALAQQGEQQGWKWVPVEPTPEMLKAPPNAWEADAKITYAAMLAAAPAPQAQEPAKCNHCGGTGELEQFTSAGAPTTKMVCLFCKGDKSFPVFKDKNPELAWIEQCKRDEEPAPQPASEPVANFIVSAVVIKDTSTGFNTQHKLYPVSAANSDEATGKALSLVTNDFPGHRLHTMCFIQIAPAPQAQEQSCPECHCHFVGSDVTAPGSTRLVNTAQQAQPAQASGRTNPGDETGGAVERFGWQTFLGKSPEIIPATNGSFVWYSDYLKLWQSAQPKQEPVKFLANGTRFKLSFDTRGRVSSLWNFMDELDGRWVALVAAEDDCHLQSTQPKQEPLTDGS